MSQFMQSDADQKIGVDVRRESCAAVIRGRVVRRHQPEQLELRIPDGDVRLALDGSSIRQRVKRRIAYGGAAQKLATNRRVRLPKTGVRAGRRTAPRAAVIDLDVDCDVVGD